jgi:23S rRNA (adenine2030-N6)-methyltransferase
MLSYQHHYHAGNAADVHKHAVLAWMLDYLVRKPKPLSYIETHAGRGLYDLGDAAAIKTGEAAAGVGRLAQALPSDHPYRRCLDAVRTRYGPKAYPGSPLIAGLGLRAGDTLHLAELHPGEHAHLRAAMTPYRAHLHKRDGFDLAHALCPPMPRRGLMLIDPSYEVKADYDALPRHMARIARAWNVGILMLWYPILTPERHDGMLTALRAAFPDALRHEVRFPSPRTGRGMTGSGRFVVNPPHGLTDETTRISGIFGEKR